MSKSSLSPVRSQDRLREPPVALALHWWGKAAGDGLGWHPLWAHSLDVAATGVVLLERWPALHQWLATRLALSPPQTLDWVGFWLGVHDLGKFAEAFQAQRPDLFRILRGREPNPAKGYGMRHDSLGMLFWDRVVRPKLIEAAWFGPRTEDLADGLDCWMRASSGHHGQPPWAVGAWKDHFHPHEDKAAALDQVHAMRELFLHEDLMTAVASQDVRCFVTASEEASWWMAGLAVLADWLGSNTTFFPYLEAEPATPFDSASPFALAEYWHRARQQAERAVSASGVVPPKAADSRAFGELFPGLSNPSPLQRWASEVPLFSGPQMHCLEDVTGAGKTEAALMLSHRLLAAGTVSGFFVALPTMATANAMYARIASSYQRMFDHPASLMLATSARSLVDDFAASVVENMAASVLPQDVDEGDAAQKDESASARCAAWLADHHKRALLSPAGVGTLDQALMAVLHSKHQSLRLLGLQGKLLVVDEVHACDAYMLKVLAVLLEFHARGGGSAVLLSATLPMQGKRVLYSAFARGLGQAPPQLDATAYPLATVWPAAGAKALQQAIDTRPDVRRSVRVVQHERLADVVALIRLALAQGQCVCWIRNTVADAVDAFGRFEAELPPERLWLFHARFALRDRLDMEHQVLHAFGKTSGAADRAGRLLIATQVVEQSLDVDFDVLVSDLAPIDRLVQRAGRLHRHRRQADGAPQTDAKASDARGGPVLHVLCPPWSESPTADWYKAAFPKAAAVYGHHGHSWLTMQRLRSGSFTMPDDARELIEGVFGDEAELPRGLEANAAAAEGQGYAAQSQAMMNTLTLGLGYTRGQSGGVDWWSDAHTPSRLGEATSTVALARWDGTRLLPWVEGRHCWAYSSVRLAKRAIAANAPNSEAALQAAIDHTLQQMPAQGRWMVLLPLVQTADGWIGQALAEPVRGRPAALRRWRYDPRRGLEAWSGETTERSQSSHTQEEMDP